MIDGFYTITFRGMADWGMGMVVFQNGTLTGADAAGVIYDGRYDERGDDIALEIVMVVPPGAALVQGKPAQPTSYTVPFTALIPKRALDTNEPVLVNMPPGPVNVIFKRLRSLRA